MHKLEVTQVYKVYRTTVLDVDAPDRETARERVMNGEVDLPSYDDPRWVETHKSLENEEVER